MSRQRILICCRGHLFRDRDGAGRAGDALPVPCPLCGRVVSGRVVDPRALSQEALAEAWQHSAARR